MRTPMHLVATWRLDIEDVVTGRRRSVELGRNLIVNGGLDAMKDRLLNPSTAQALFGYVAIGTGATPETASDVALETEARREASSYAAGGTGVCTVSRVFAADATPRSYTEAGLFDAASAGVMLNRKTFTAVPIGATENVTVSCTFSIANG